MRTVSLATALLLAVTVVALAAEPLPKLRRDQDYGRTRQALVSAGWEPVTLPGADACMDGDERCAGRKEMFACAGSGLAQCVFTWRRGGTVIDVVTEGEQPQFARLRCRSGCR